MEKVKRRNSIKWKFLTYSPISLVIAFLGSWVIGTANNHLQTWYVKHYNDGEHFTDQILFEYEDDGEIHYEYQDGRTKWSVKTMKGVGFLLVSGLQVVLVPIWVALCFSVTGVIFYKRELESSIHMLIDSADKIADNCLDFKLETTKQNELGKVCDSFEHMRKALYQTNKENFRMMEERKRLNAAFSHDMRTPITVLKGYSDLLEKYIPDGKISQQKLLEILDMMQAQIIRLESYTQKMGNLQKLEDVTPCPREVKWEEFWVKIGGISEVLAEEYQIEWDSRVQAATVWMDEEIVLEVYENMFSNAVRYAEGKIIVTASMEKGQLAISVEDDGVGFSEEALVNAMHPFYREDKWENQSHFGLGLYISKILCERCRGELRLENGRTGAKVTAVFAEEK